MNENHVKGNSSLARSMPRFARILIISGLMGCSAPSRSEPESAKIFTVGNLTLRVKQEPDPTSNLRLELGPFKSRDIILMSLFGIREAVDEKALTPRAKLLDTRVVEVQTDQLNLEQGHARPGFYQLKVRDGKSEKIWDFAFSLRASDLLGQCESALVEVDQFIERARDISIRLTAASQRRITWEQSQARMRKELREFVYVCKEQKALDTYSAASSFVIGLLEKLEADTKHFRFSGEGELEEPKGYASRLERQIHYASDIEGRELCLWILKQVRFDSSKVSEVARILKQNGRRPGVAPFASRLLSLATEDVLSLEKDIRRIALPLE